MQALLNSEGVYQLGQAGTVLETFSPGAPSQDVALSVFLSVVGTLATIIGVMIPLAAIGVAATFRVSTKGVAQATIKGNSKTEDLIARSPGQTPIQSRSENGNPIENPDAITPVPKDQAATLRKPGDNKPNSDTHPVTMSPDKANPRTNDKVIIGTLGWAAPGSLIILGDIVWGLVRPESNSLH